MPKVSVIIPVYNAKDYLERCLDSVCNQTLKDIEIICVNDCSTDTSLEILNNYANKYCNLKVIDCKKNGGESKARNIGLENATGEYIAFVDNDDTIDLDFYEKLYLKATETDADIVKGEAKIHNYDGTIKIDTQTSEIRKNNSRLFFTHNWWTAIYKTRFIKDNNIKLIEGYILGGDILFLNSALILSDKFELVDGVFYHYYRRENSGDSKILSLEKIKSALDIYEMIFNSTNKYIDKLDKNGVIHIYYWCLLNLIYCPYRRNTFDALNLCIKRAFKLYKKCFYAYDFTKKASDLNNKLMFYYLQNGSKEGLINYIQASDTKKIIQQLHFKHMMSRSNND